MSKIKPTTVDEYIDQAPQNAQEKLKEIRSILREIAPNASEALKWNTPVFEDKRILFAYAAFKNHMNFMPTPSTLIHFQKELAGYVTGQGSIQLPYDKPLSKALIRKIAAYRVMEVKENDARWM